MHNSITIRLPDAMVQSIDEICKKQESTRQEVIRTALSMMLFNDNHTLGSNSTNNPETPKISESRIEQSTKQISSNKIHTRLRAIVIEDDQDMRDVFTEILQIYNITVIGTGSNGKEAANLYEKLRPDVVFMDIIMPTYDGFHGTNEIKKIDPDAKIILVTGATIDAKKIPLANTAQIVRKPLDMKDILSAVDKIMVAS